MIKVKYFGFLKKFMPETDSEGWWLVENDGVSIEELFDIAKVPTEYRRATLLVNKSRKTPEYRLHDGDVLTVMPLVAGG